MEEYNQIEFFLSSPSSSSSSSSNTYTSSSLSLSPCSLYPQPFNKQNACTEAKEGTSALFPQQQQQSQSQNFSSENDITYSSSCSSSNRDSSTTTSSSENSGCKGMWECILLQPKPSTTSKAPSGFKGSVVVELAKEKEIDQRDCVKKSNRQDCEETEICHVLSSNNNNDVPKVNNDIDANAFDKSLDSFFDDKEEEEIAVSPGKLYSLYNDARSFFKRKYATREAPQSVVDDEHGFEIGIDSDDDKLELSENLSYKENGECFDCEMFEKLSLGCSSSSNNTDDSNNESDFMSHASVSLAENRSPLGCINTAEQNQLHHLQYLMMDSNDDDFICNEAYNDFLIKSEFNSSINDEICNEAFNSFFNQDLDSSSDELCNKALDQFLNLSSSFSTGGDATTTSSVSCSGVSTSSASKTTAATSTATNILTGVNSKRTKVFPCIVCAEMLPSLEQASNHCNNNFGKRKADSLNLPPSKKPTPGESLDKNFVDKLSENKQKQQQQQQQQHKCSRCGQNFKSLIGLNRHMRACNRDPLPPVETIRDGNILRRKVSSAINENVQNIRFENTSDENMLLDEFFSNSETLISDTLSQLYKDKHYAKVAFSIKCTYEKPETDNNEQSKTESTDFFHHIGSEIERNIDLNSVKNAFENQIATFNKKATGFVLKNIKFMDMNINSRFTISHHIGSKSGPVKLPSKLTSKHAVINVQLTSDKKDECFKYSILAAIHSSDIRTNRCQASKYQQFADHYNWENIQYPATAEDVLRFQRQNKGIYVNLFSYENDTPTLVCPAKISTNDLDVKGKVINIMAVKVNDEDFYHYVAIVDLNRLLNNKHENIRFNWCDRCVRPFPRGSIKNFEDHRKACFGLSYPSVRMPEPNTFLQFKNHLNTQRLPYVVYCDIECYLEKVPNSLDRIHKPHAFGVFLCPQKNTKAECLDASYKVFTGPSCIQDGLEHIFSLSKDVYRWNQRNARFPKKLTLTEKELFQKATHCASCMCLFDGKVTKCQDHDHVTGEYRAALCRECNFKMCLSRNKLPVVFHNLMNYDGHIVINSLAQLNKNIIGPSLVSYLFLRKNLQLLLVNTKLIHT